MRLTKTLATAALLAAVASPTFACSYKRLDTTAQSPMPAPVEQVAEAAQPAPTATEPQATAAATTPAAEPVATELASAAKDAPKAN